MSVQDLDQVLAMEQGTPGAPHWDRAAYEKLLSVEGDNVRYGAFTATDGVDLTGFVIARQVLEICDIDSIVVAQGARRRGVGRALFDEVLRWAAGGGAQRVQLEVRAGNATAIRFYERAGLLREGLRRDYYSGPGEGAVLMGKSLYSTD